MRVADNLRAPESAPASRSAGHTRATVACRSPRRCRKLAQPCFERVEVDRLGEELIPT
jgi:hypothetical protein